MKQTVRELREARGLTQKQLAPRAGIPQSHLSRIEIGMHAPREATRTRLADALGVSTDDVCWERENKREEQPTMTLRATDQAYPGPASSRGIDVRTWLAGMALCGTEASKHTAEEAAEHAVAVADAVLRRLNGCGNEEASRVTTP